MTLVPRNNNLGVSLFDNMFDDFFKDPFFTRNNSVKVMKTDIQEKDDKYILDMDLPGYDKEDIKAQLKDGYLTITAQKNTSNEDKDEKGNYIRRERYCGKCSRSFYVGDSIKEEDIKANFNNGILQLSFPKEVARKDEEGNYVRRERSCGKCSRSFYVGDSIKEEDIKASFNNGILELTFPKEVPQKEEEMKYITID